MSTPFPNTTLQVPTKSEDNCSYSYASFFQEYDVGQEQERDQTRFDAFQHYSSDLTRLKTLLLKPSDEEDDDDESTALAAVNDALRRAGLNDLTATQAQVNKSKIAKRRRGNDSEPIKQQELGNQERKTRLSWELHPSLLLYELYDELEDEDDIDIGQPGQSR